MKGYLIPLLFLVSVSVLGYCYNLLGFPLLLVCAFCLAFLLVAGIVRLFRKKLSPRWVKVPVKVIVISLAGVVAGLLRPLEAAVLQSGSVSHKLAHAYKTDQADRKTVRAYVGAFSDNMAVRDILRLSQVWQLYKNRQIKEPVDKFHAAFVFHHNRHKSSALYEIAHALASEAAAANHLKNDYVVHWLAKASYDRWKVSLGKPQKFGTQDNFSLSVN